MPLESWLVGGIPTPLKNMKGSWDYYSQLNGKIKFMFQTTNQTSCICLGGIRSKQHLQIVIPSPDIFHSLYIDSTWSQIWVCAAYGFQGGLILRHIRGRGLPCFRELTNGGGNFTKSSCHQEDFCRIASTIRSKQSDSFTKRWPLVGKLT